MTGVKPTEEDKTMAMTLILSVPVTVGFGMYVAGLGTVKGAKCVVRKTKHQVRKIKASL